MFLDYIHNNLRNYSQLAHCHSFIVRPIHFIVIFPSDSGQHIYIQCACFHCVSIDSLLIFEKSLNKCGYHIVNRSHTAIMLNRHSEPSLLHTYAKTQPNTTAKSHYCKTYARTKYPHQTGNIHHIIKLFDVYILWKYYNIYAINELTGICYVTRTTVNR